MRAQPKVQREDTGRGLAKPGTIRSSHARPFQLDAPSPQRTALELGQPSRGAPLKVGFGRDIPGLDSEAGTHAALDWKQLADGSLVAAISVTSASAQSVRAALLVNSLPASAIVRFQAPGAAEVFEVSGEDVNATIAQNIDSGETGTQARLYWSPLIDGDAILVEVQLAPGTDPAGLRISIPHVSHLVTSAAKNFAVATKASSACEVDAMCPSTSWGPDVNQMNAVARMIFSDGTGTFACSGTLLADQDAASQIPYFLSANHCISTQASASSLTTYWFYRSSSCGATTAGPYRQLTGGATLLYASNTTDTSFMRLNSTPPTGAVFAGWFVGTTPAVSTAVSGLHHPQADLLKRSAGGLTGYLTCTPPTNGQFTCSSATASTSTFYRAGWTSGITEPGSSGSGLFRSDGTLIGQLYGGSGTCSAPADDIYGRFDVAYNAGVKSWLSGQTLTVAKSGTGSGTVTSTPAGINCGTACSAGFASGTSVSLSATAASGSVFSGWSGACTGTGACTIAMNASTSVTASFASATATLSVTTTGSGTVSSDPAGINCGATCSAPFALGAAVMLTATPASGMAFTGWTGACTGTASCTVAINGATAVGATFAALLNPTVTLASSVNPSSLGQAIILTANVAGSAATPTGTMSFFSDGAAVCMGQPIASGVATCSTSGLAAGNHSLVATYSGDSHYNPATSASLVQSVTGSSGTTPATRLFGLSTRMQVLTGDNVLIGGFVIGGAAPKTVVIRARGPSLGIAGALADPTLTLVPASGTAITNDDWGTAANAAQLSATGFAPGNAKESAIMATLNPGAYTAIVSGVANTTGVAIVEVYEIDHPEIPLTGISTRGQVLTGGNVMIGGFVIQGSGPQTVIVRARGPSLASAGIANVLANPTLTLVRASDGSVAAVNDDWATAANAAQVSASGFAPASSLESAILITLDPGAYTAIVSGVGGTTGVGIVEVYAQ